MNKNRIKNKKNKEKNKEKNKNKTKNKNKNNNKNNNKKTEKIRKKRKRRRNTPFCDEPVVLASCFPRKPSCPKTSLTSRSSVARRTFHEPSAPPPRCAIEQPVCGTLKRTTHTHNRTKTRTGKRNINVAR